jgi:hypothetical protein
MTSGKARRRMRFCGTSIEWDRQGNLTIDATSAHAYQLGPKGQPVVAPAKVTLKTQSAELLLDPTGLAKLTAATKAHLNAPLTELSDTSPHPLLFGDTFNSKLDPYLQAEIDLATDQVIQWNTISGLCTVPPLTTIKAYFEKLAQGWNKYLLALQTMKAAQPSWISGKVKTG